MIQFFVVRNIPFHKYVIVLSYLRHTDVTSRGTYAECHPMVCTCLPLIELLCKCMILECIVVESNPIVIPRLKRRGITGVTLDFLCPVIRLFHHFKLNGNIRTADLIQFNFYQEESNILIVWLFSHSIAERCSSLALLTTQITISADLPDAYVINLPRWSWFVSSS